MSAMVTAVVRLVVSCVEATMIFPIHTKALFGGAFYSFYYSNQLEKLEAPPNRPAFPSS